MPGIEQDCALGASFESGDLAKAPTMNSSYTFRDIVGLTTFLKVLLGLGVAMALVSMLSSYMQADLISRGNYTEAEAKANNFREQVVSLSVFALRLLTIIVFGVWIVRANKNVRALGADGLRITPGWAVGYFFAPILNLWRPYQAMKDLWRASQNPISSRDTRAGLILPTWWAFWLLAAIVGQISFRMSWSAASPEDFKNASYAEIVSGALDIPLCLSAMVLVSQIASAQTKHALNGG